MRYGVLILLFLFLFGPTALGAEERQLTLPEAVRAALEGNREVRAHGSALAAGREDIGIARSALLPKVFFEERFLRTNNPTYSFMAKLNQERFSSSDFELSALNDPKPVSDFQTALSFEQPLFNRQAAIGLDMAKRSYAAQSDSYGRKREEVAYRVVATFLAARTAQEQVAAARKTVEDTREHLRVADLRHTAGLGLYSDVLRASTAVSEAEQRLVSAEKSLAVAERALGLLLGLTESVSPAGEPVSLPLMESAYYVAASLSRKDVQAIGKRYEQARSGVRFAEADYFPTVSFGGAYQLNDHRRPFGTEGESWQLGAVLRWNLFDGAGREHERAKAKHRAAEAAEQMQGLKDAVSFQVYEAFLGVAEAKKNAELSLAALKTAEEGARLVRLRYENSLSPLVDLLDAQIRLDHARAAVAARENEYQSALAALGYQGGTLLKDLGIE